MRILAINRGSSSLKFALYSVEPNERRVFSGSLSGIEKTESCFRVQDTEGHLLTDQSIRLSNRSEAVERMLEWLKENRLQQDIDAVGYRIVHGGPDYRQPTAATPEVVDSLEAVNPIDLEHMPAALAAVRTVQQSLPNIPHVLCFDTAFHRNMPAVAQTIALPKPLRDEGLLRYGFHGLSYEYIIEQLGHEARDGRLIIAHLGNGASMVAVKDGRSVETTMGFSPTSGLVMSTRTGDIDPAIILYLLRQKHMDADQINELVNKHAGLLGISGFSSDMQELLDKATQDPNAALAVDSFCYHARQFIGALTASLGGLDRLIFTGGIGENSSAIRQCICNGLQFLGVRLDANRNDVGAEAISAEDSCVVVNVMKTNEELMIVRHTWRFVGPQLR